MKCPKCGNELSENQKFCTCCGAKVIENEHDDKTDNQEATSQNTDNSEQKSIISEYENVCKHENLELQVLIKIGIIILFIAIMFFIAYFPNNNQDIKLLEQTVRFNNLGDIMFTVKYNPQEKCANIILNADENILEDWQIDNIDRYQYVYELYVKGNASVKAPKIEYERAITKQGEPLVIEFKIENINLSDFVNIKKLITENIDNNSITISCPPIYNTNEILRNKEKEKWLQQKKEEEKAAKEAAEDEEIISNVQDYAYTVIDGEKYAIDYNPRKCLFNVNGVCFGRPFFVNGMSYMDCKNQKNKLGIKYCEKSEDLFASTAFVCGGTKYMPTPDELVMLAKDLYKDDKFDNLKPENSCSGAFYFQNCNYKESERYNDKDYIEYFREIAWRNKNFENAEKEERRNNLGFAIFSNTEAGKYSIYSRMFQSYYSSLGLANRYHVLIPYSDVFLSENMPFSICVTRDKNYTESKAKYPIKLKDFTPEVENDLF